MDNQLETVITELVSRLRACGATLVTAESCTGGWVAKVLTDRAGSSDWFDCGFVTYSNRAKQQMLGVDPSLLQQYGAVSGECVRAMAEGAIRCSGAGAALSISGVAGPGGGSPEKPVGTVWFGWLRTGGEAVIRCHHFQGDRDAVRRQAVMTALIGMVDLFGQA